MSGNQRRLRHRLIVELCHGAADARTLRAIAELAAQLNLDLYGLFIEDAALFDLAELSFARELRLPTHEWQPVDAAQIAADLHHAATDVQHMLREIAAACDVPIAFEVRRGDPVETIAAIASGSDVLVIAEPAMPGRCVAPLLSRMQLAAHASAASVLLLPRGAAPRSGPVAVLLADAEDPGLAAAAQAVVNTRERLLVLLPAHNAALADAVTARAVALGVPRARIRVKTLADAQAGDIARALGREQERLLVLTRDASAVGSAVAATRLASERGVPVLLVEPPAAAI